MPHNVSAERVIGAWDPPARGVMRHMPAYKVPTDGVFEASNVVYRKGFLMPRPGLLGLTSDGVLARPVGLASIANLAESSFAGTAFDGGGFTTTADERYLVAMTTQAVWAYYNAQWNNLMAGSAGSFYTADGFDPLSFAGNSPSDVLSGGPSNLGRFAAMEIDSDTLGRGLYVMAVNGQDEPRIWDTRTNTVSVASDWPRFSDVIQLESRFVGIVPPYEVRWGEALSIAAPAKLNVRFLAETTDKLVSILSLGGNTSYYLLKEETIWSARAVGGASSQFFSFDFKFRVTGPASPSAVQVLDGVAFYMTPSGRVAAFNGQTVRWLGEGAWVQIRDGSKTFAKIDKQYSNRIVSSTDPLNREIHFFYPQEGDNGNLYGVCTVTLPDLEAGVESFGVFPGRLSVPVSAATPREGSFQDSVVMRSDVEYTAFTQAGTLDASQPFSGYWQTGLVAAPGMEPFRMEGHESMFERGADYGTVRVIPMFSYILDTPGGSQGASTVVDLAATKVKDEKGGDVRGRFFGLRYEFTTPLTMLWQGARLAARRIEHAPQLTAR